MDPQTSVKTSAKKQVLQWKSDGSSDTQVTMGQLVEVRYDDDVWYKGKFNAETEEWFDKKTSINFPDDDVRLS